MFILEDPQGFSMFAIKSVCAQLYLIILINKMCSCAPRHQVTITASPNPDPPVGGMNKQRQTKTLECLFGLAWELFVKKKLLSGNNAEE